MNPSKRRELDTRTVVGVEVTIVELVWPDGGRSFDVHRTTDGLCLTMEGSFDTIPTNDQIVRLFSTVQCRHCFTRPDLGYRYDHAHGSRTLAERLTACEYVHETREAGPDGSHLTDHSGLAVRVALNATTALLTSDPATAATHAEPEPTLF